MGTYKNLDFYLEKLNRALGNISASEKAEIILEIKSHVESACEAEGKTVEDILQSLGEPETVANRFLLERGLTPNKPPRHPVIKWLVIAFLGTFGLISFLILALVWRFTPLIEVNEKEGQVKLLGGIISVDEDDSDDDEIIENPDGTTTRKKVDNADGHHARLKVDDIEIDLEGLGVLGILGEIFQDHETHDLDGRYTPKKGEDTLRLDFRNGKIELEPSSEETLSWDCRVNSDDETPSFDPTSEDNVIHMDMEKFKGVKCNIRIPPLSQVTVNGANGKVDIEDPRYDVDLDLANGMVNIDPDSQLNYDYDLRLNNGSMDTFPSKEGPKDHTIKVRLSNGKIAKD